MLSEINRENLTLRGNRIELSRVQIQDASDEYLLWINDIDVNKFLETRWISQNLETVISHIKKVSSSPTELLLKIVVVAEKIHIGNIKIGPIDVNNKSAELSFLIGDKSFWGQGYATEAINLCVDYCFETLGLYKIQAGCFETNIGSRKALLKSGFELEGRLRKRILAIDGSREDHLWFGRINETQ
jgi:ribosomal-protein-alanine N-acetyltransferase